VVFREIPGKLGLLEVVHIPQTVSTVAAVIHQKIPKSRVWLATTQDTGGERSRAKGRRLATRGMMISRNDDHAGLDEPVEQSLGYNPRQPAEGVDLQSAHGL